MMKRKNIPFIILILSVLFFAIQHEYLNDKASKEFKKFRLNNPQSNGDTYAFTWWPDGETAVININKGEKNNKILYTEKNGNILKITPKDIVVIKGTFNWRFFISGIIKGDSMTKFMVKYILPNKLPESKFGIRLDPTNPSPFTVVLILFILSFIIVKIT